MSSGTFGTTSPRQVGRLPTSFGRANRSHPWRHGGGEEKNPLSRLLDLVLDPGEVFCAVGDGENRDPELAEQSLKFTLGTRSLAPGEGVGHEVTITS